MADYRIREGGDSLIIIEYAARIDPEINARAISLARALTAVGHGGVRDIVPTYRSVGVHFDPLRVDFDRLMADVERFAAAAADAPEAPAPPIVVPVIYGGARGPDLEAVAAFARCAPEEVIRLHGAPLYRVYMLGFMPGRAYLARVDPRIAAPRHATPRLNVPAGSVGIARWQTGFSATTSPNGWQIIGWTPVTQFDISRADPFFFKPGDLVKFEAVDRV